MADKMSRFCSPSPNSAAFPYATSGGGGADSASGGSGGSGMECMQLRSPPGPFHYLISEQAKSFVALQELQNEVGALLEFRDLVIETFPNLRSKMAPGGSDSGDAGGGRDWEPGVRVRRKLASAAGDPGARGKPQPSVQDSGFSTETSSSRRAVAPLEDELCALLDMIQRKGSRLRDDVELLRGELERSPPQRREVSSIGSCDDGSGGAEEEFARALRLGCPGCGDARHLRRERDALLASSAERAASASVSAHAKAPHPPHPPRTPATPRPAALGRLDGVLATPPRPPRVNTPDSTKIAAILRESDPVELQRHLLLSTVHAQVMSERLERSAAARAALLERLQRTREENDDLKFQLEEKTIELEGAKAWMRTSEGGRDARRPRLEHAAAHSSMRDMQPLHIPDTPPPPPPPSTLADPITDTPKRSRRSRIPLPGHKALAPKPPTGRDSASYRSRSGESQSWRASLATAAPTVATARSPAARLRAPAAAAAAAPRDSLSRISHSSDSLRNGRREATPAPASKKASSVPVRRAGGAGGAGNAVTREVHRDDGKVRSKSIWNMIFNFKETSSS